MKRNLLAFFIVLTFSVVSYSQSDKIWKTADANQAGTLSKIERNGWPTEYKIYNLQLDALRNMLKNAPALTQSQSGSSVVVNFPDAEGKLQSFEIYEASVMEPELQAKYPEIRSYTGKGIGNSGAIVRFSVSPQKGLSLLMRSVNGVTTIIDPYTKDNDYYLVFDKSKSIGKEPFVCHTEEEEHFGDALKREAIAFNANDNIKRTFRLAMSVTGEYAAFHGGTLATVNAAINTTLTRVNGLYENDMNTTFVLVANNDSVVYLNAATDPYGSESGWANALQNALNINIGNANYDIGHLMGGIGSNGSAGCIGCVCSTGKGRGYTTSTNPIGDTFDIDYVAHEMGHQLGANHTYSVDIEGTQVNVEPGSGSTIMGYAGLTGFELDVQLHSDAYFHIVSIQQIMNNIKNKSCPTLTTINNATPVVDAGNDITLPIGTAFYLTGTGTDTNANDILTYCWEQVNSATNANQTIPNPTRTAGPMFRSFSPSTSPTRYFPNFADVVNYGVEGNRWERVPNVTRNLNFKFTVRDNKLGGASNASDEMIARFNTAYGPFVVTSQNAMGVSWEPNSQQTITWLVNNTQTLAGASNVNIRLSTDGGVTFPVYLATNVPNNGSATITVPGNLSGPFCRLLIEPTANQFYAVNSVPFSIGYTVTTTCQTYANTVPVNIPDGVGQGQPGEVAYSLVNVPASNVSISDVNVRVNITHPYVSDLILVLLSPHQIQKYLWSNSCGSQDGLNITFDDQGAPVFNCGGNTGIISGTYKPLESFITFNGLPANGTWALAAVDFYRQDAGVINSWELEICSQEVILSTPNFGLQSFLVYPNPNKGNFTVEFDQAVNEPVIINVYDIRGRNVHQKIFGVVAQFKETIDIHQMQSGVYFLEVVAGSKKEVKKIVVE